jgi:hypothetical protein
MASAPRLDFNRDKPANPRQVDPDTRQNSMKAYLATTGTVFGLIALLHLWRAIDNWRQLQTHPGNYLIMSALGVIAAGLSVWAWRLLRLRA